MNDIDRIGLRLILSGMSNGRRAKARIKRVYRLGTNDARMAALMANVILRSVAHDGGPGSGNFGHRGRPGQVGGSGKGGGSAISANPKLPGEPGTPKSPSLVPRTPSPVKTPSAQRAGGASLTLSGGSQHPSATASTAAPSSYGGKKSSPPGQNQAGNSSSAANIKVDGPQQTKSFIDSYFKEHPEVREEAKKYKDVLNNVRNFQKMHPDAVDGTYDAVTGELLNIDTGYCVTFHQNKSIDDPFGAYDADDYAAMCAITLRELGSKTVNIGYFGNPEVSFQCDDFERAKRFAIEHNQHSIFDCAEGRVIKNDLWNPNTNPIDLDND